MYYLIGIAYTNILDVRSQKKKKKDEKWNFHILNYGGMRGRLPSLFQLCNKSNFIKKL